MLLFNDIAIGDMIVNAGLTNAVGIVIRKNEDEMVIYWSDLVDPPGDSTIGKIAFNRWQNNCHNFPYERL